MRLQHIMSKTTMKNQMTYNPHCLLINEKKLTEMDRLTEPHWLTLKFYRLRSIRQFIQGNYR